MIVIYGSNHRKRENRHYNIQPDRKLYTRLSQQLEKTPAAIFHTCGFQQKASRRILFSIYISIHETCFDQ